MLQFKILIFELFAVDRLSSSAIASRKIASLDHETFNDPMEA